MSLLQDIENRLVTALELVIGEKFAAPVVPAADLRFGDYQSNAAMALAKQRKMNPRALAEQIIAALDRTGGQVAEAARLLRVSRTTLWEKMQKLGL